MSSRRHERTSARQRTVQVLYTSEIQNEPPSALLSSGRCLLADEDGPLSDYALMLIKGVEEHQSDIDAYLETTSENWTVARMPIVDRTILRLATFEMIYVDEVPVSVSINEAVELAKDFGGEEDSPRFVNGVLGRIAKQLEGEGAAGAGAQEDAAGEGAQGDAAGVDVQEGAAGADVLAAGEPEQAAADAQGAEA